MKSVFTKDSLKKDIFGVLSVMPKTQRNDNKLFAELVRRNINRFPQYEDKLSTVAEVFENASQYGLPHYTTMIRERRELQKMFPVLVDKPTEERRLEAEEDFHIKYSRQNKGVKKWQIEE